MTTQHSIDRRRFVTAAGGALVAALAGCTGGDGGTDDDWEYMADGPDYGGWFDGTGNFEGTVDWTGADAVTVEVGVGERGYLFGPPAIAIDAGTTVTWEWTGQGGTHNVAARDGDFGSGSPEAGSGVTYEHTVQEAGTYRYVCTPHESLGMVGAVHVV